ncbi:hypothetical protein [Paenisporosarcina sp. TG20]|uniref:hypothetical protein n=1 Tax=Paenisporosarcina sp. TG20 TaxID=1211706 RepID=UPI0003056153|nr:hypothetical protein [Paenisporosarcina sp. TG20]
MKLKKIPFVLSLALSALLVVSTTGFASGLNNGETGSMMNASDSGMMNMMKNGNMTNMMNAMNSPEGQKMMNDCGNFMDSIDDEKEAE